MRYVGVFAASIVFLICLYGCLQMAWKQEWKLNWPPWLRYTLYGSLGVMMLWAMKLAWTR